MADNRLYNSRVTTETLEKKFRDTFPSQPGAELVDDLYASGVIVPVVDFTAAAEGSELRADLQTAFDFATTNATISGGVTNQVLINTPGFYRLNIFAALSASTSGFIFYFISDGASGKVIFRMDGIGSGSTDPEYVSNEQLVIFLRAGDSLQVTTSSTTVRTNISSRQIADVSGNLVNPLGFTSS